MDDLKNAIENERNGSGDPDPSGNGDDSKAEARRAKDRERKAKERAGKKAGGKEPRTPRAPKPKRDAESDEKELDPRVVHAVQMCMASMMVDEITPEFAKAMNAAMAGALQYEIEERLPFLADGFEPEVGLACGIVGSGVTRFRIKRQKSRTVQPVSVKVEEPPPPPKEPPVDPDGSSAVPQ